MMLDTFGMSALGKVAHRQLFDMTIINDGPPLDDDDVLRELTSCPKTDWARVKGELRLKGYKSVGGYFLHGGTVKTLNESKQEFVRSFNRTAAMNRQKTLILSKPDDVTGCVTINVTSNVSPPMTLTQSDSQTVRQSDRDDREKDLVVELPAGFPKNEGEAKAVAGFIGCTEEFAVETWNKAFGRGGRDAKDIAIRSWQHYLKSEMTFNKNRTEREKTYGKNNPRPNPRNAHVVGDLAENARRTAEVVKRRQAERDAEHEAV